MKLPVVGIWAGMIVVGCTVIALWERYEQHQAEARREAVLRHPSMRGAGQGALFWAPCGRVLTAEDPVRLAFDWIDHAAGCPAERDQEPAA